MGNSRTGHNVERTDLGSLPPFVQVYGRPRNAHRCALCYTSFPSRQACLQHQAQRQPTGGDILRCLKCNATSADVAQLVAHAHIHTATTVNRFPCKECGKVFDKSGYLAQHMKMHAQPQYKCPTCDRRFFWRAGRNRHAKVCATGVAYPNVTQPNPGAL